MEVSLPFPSPEYLPMFPLSFTPYRCLQDDIKSYIQFKNESRVAFVDDGSVHIAIVLRIPARCAFDGKVLKFYAKILLPKRFGGLLKNQRAKTTINYRDHPISKKPIYCGTVTFTMRRIGPLPPICLDLPLILPGGHSHRRDNALKVLKGAVRIIGMQICKKCAHIVGHGPDCPNAPAVPAAPDAVA